jgi:hypothetical protein
MALMLTSIGARQRHNIRETAQIADRVAPGFSVFWPILSALPHRIVDSSDEAREETQ